MPSLASIAEICGPPPWTTTGRMPAGLQAHPWREDRLLVAVPTDADHPAPDAFKPSDIDETRLLMLEDGHCLTEHALAACNRPDLRAEAQMLGTSLHTVVQMVDNGLGMTMLPEMALNAGILEHTRVEARPLDAPHASRQVALVWRRASPRERDFRLLAGLLAESH